MDRSDLPPPERVADKLAKVSERLDGELSSDEQGWLAAADWLLRNEVKGGSMDAGDFYRRHYDLLEEGFEAGVSATGLKTEIEDSFEEFQKVEGVNAWGRPLFAGVRERSQSEVRYE